MTHDIMSLMKKGIGEGLIRAVYDVGVEKMMKAHSRNAASERDLLIRHGATEFVDVRLSSDRLRQGIYVMVYGGVWILFASLFAFFFLGGDSVQVKYVTILFPVIFIPFFFIAGYFHTAGLYKKYSGYGIGYDLSEQRKYNNNILVHDGGIGGILNINWLTIHAIRDAENLDVELHCYQKSGILGKLITKPPLILTFSNSKDKDSFLSLPAVKRYLKIN